MILRMLKLCGISLAFLLVSTLSANEPAKQQTFSMIKPHAVKKQHIGEIIAMIEKSGLRVTALKMQNLSKEKAETFYAEHKERPFFNDLVQMMSSGPIVTMVVEGNNAVLALREIVGATDPKKAAPGTIRATFGNNVQENSIHASDSTASASREIPFFFSGEEIFE